MLARPMSADPGSAFNYGSGGSQVLSAVVGRAAGLPAARFACLYLNGGWWDGRQVVPRAWVEESKIRQSEGHPWFGAYGLHRWLRPLADARAGSTFFAMGYGGQCLFVVPALDLVAVFLGWMPGEPSFLPMRWLEQRVVRAVR